MRFTYSLRSIRSSNFGEVRVLAKLKNFREVYLKSFVFIHINKTAGSSVQRSLGIPHEHKTAMEKINDIGWDAWNRKFTFTFVRNPWDKVVSHYHYRVKTDQTGLASKNIDFITWVKMAYGNKDPEFYDRNKMFMPQVKWISDKDGGFLVDFIGRFERLQRDFECICDSINKKRTDLLFHEKKSSREDYRNYYNEDTISIIAEHFRADIEKFDYSFE